MRAFGISLVALLLITVAAAATLQMLPGRSSSDVFQDRPNVRL